MRERWHGHTDHHKLISACVVRGWGDNHSFNQSKWDALVNDAKQYGGGVGSYFRGRQKWIADPPRASVVQLERFQPQRESTCLASCTPDAYTAHLRPLLNSMKVWLRTLTSSPVST